MELTAENYYSPEANAEYMSVSQFKSFAGTDGKLACEAEAMAELRGEWEMKKTTALMVGSYVDSYFEGTLDDFKKRTPELFTQKGTLNAPEQAKYAQYITLHYSEFPPACQAREVTDTT